MGTPFKQARPPLLLDVRDFGVRSNGSADDTTNLQVAIDTAVAVNASLALTPGSTTIVNSPLTMRTGLRLFGSGVAGAGRSRILYTGSGNSMWQFATSTVTHSWELENLVLECAASSGHVFLHTSGTSDVFNAKIRNCVVAQNDTAKGIWAHTNGDMVQIKWEDCYISVYGASRSYPGFYFHDAGGTFNANIWNNCTFEMVDGCNDQYMFEWECETTGDYSHGNVMRDCVFEICNGGLVKLNGVSGFLFDNVQNWDQGANAVTAHCFNIGQHASGNPSKNTTFTNTNRYTGGVLQAGIQDIKISDADVVDVIVDGFRAVGTPMDDGRIDVGSASAVYLRGISSGTTVLNSTNAIWEKADGTIAMKGYPLLLSLGAAAFSPADGTTYYLGPFKGNNPSTIATSVKEYIPRAGIIKSVRIFCFNSGVLGSNEASTYSVRLNNTTDYQITNAFTHDAETTTAINASLNGGAGIAVAANDYIEIKWAAPTWATNPTSIRHVIEIYMETT